MMGNVFIYCFLHFYFLLLKTQPNPQPYLLLFQPCSKVWHQNSVFSFMPAMASCDPAFVRWQHFPGGVCSLTYAYPNRVLLRVYRIDCLLHVLVLALHPSP